MAMTAQVKAEIANTTITKTCCRKAEVSTMLRFAGGLHIVSGKIVVEARARHRSGGPPAPQGHRRGLRAPERRRHGPGERHPEGQPLPGARRQGRRGPRPADRPARQPRPARPRPPAGRRLRRRLRRGRCLARRLPGPRLAHRAGALVVPRGHLPRPGGGTRTRRRRPTARHPGQGPRGARHRPGRDPRRRRDLAAAHPARRPRGPDGLGGAPDAARGPRHRQPARQLRRRQPPALGAGGRRRGGPGPSARWRSSATRCPTT